MSKVWERFRTFFSTPQHHKEQLLIYNPSAVSPYKFFFSFRSCFRFLKNQTQEIQNMTKHKKNLQRKLRFPNPSFFSSLGFFIILKKFFFCDFIEIFYPIGMLPHHLLSRSLSSKKLVNILEITGQPPKSGINLDQGDGGDS